MYSQRRMHQCQAEEHQEEEEAVPEAEEPRQAEEAHQDPVCKTEDNNEDFKRLFKDT